MQPLDLDAIEKRGKDPDMARFDLPDLIDILRRLMIENSELRERLGLPATEQPPTMPDTCPPGRGKKEAK